MSKQPRRYTLDKDVADVLEEYKKENRDQLIISGVTDDSGIVKKLVLEALKPWLDKHSELKDKYLLKLASQE